MEQNKKVKRYFWFQHSNHFLTDSDRLIMRAQKEGYKVIWFYQWLLEQSCDKEGHVYYKNGIPFNETLISNILGEDFSKEFILSSIDLFKALDLVDVLEDGTLFMRESLGIIGSISEQQMKRNEYYMTHKEKKSQSALHSNEHQLGLYTATLIQTLENANEFDSKQRAMTDAEIASLKDYFETLIQENDFETVYGSVIDLSRQITRMDVPVRNYFAYVKNALPAMILQAKKIMN